MSPPPPPAADHSRPVRRRLHLPDQANAAVAAAAAAPLDEVPSPNAYVTPLVISTFCIAQFHAILQQQKPSGIYNAGTDCHVIVIVQLLRVTLAPPKLDELKAFLEPQRRGPRPCNFTRALCNLIDSQADLARDRQPFRDFMQVFRDRLDHRQYLAHQQDATETLTKIIERLTAELQGDNSWFNFSSALLLGRFTRHVHCEFCPAAEQPAIRAQLNHHFPNPTTGTHSINISAALLQQPTSVHMLIDLQLSNDLPFGEDDFHSEAFHNGQSRITTAYALLQPAHWFLIHIDRCGNGDVYNKTPISPTDIIELRVDGVELIQRYQLAAVVVHLGASMNSGHYIFFGRTAAVPDRWYYANDQNVSVINGASPTQHLNYNGTFAQLWAAQSHLLLYRKL